MARSGVRVAKHCSRTSACLCLLLIVYEEYACASRDSEGRGEDVALKLAMLKSYKDGSTSEEE